MKTIKLNSLCFIAIIPILVLYISSCKKKDDSVSPATPTGTLLFHMHSNIDTNEVDYGTVYHTENNRRIAVNKAQLYISNIQLIKLDGSTYSMPNSIVYKVAESEVYTIGQVPVGNYKSVRFYVGLDAATSQRTPTGADTALNQPSMWYGNSAQPSGYVFVNIQGSIDTSASLSTTAALIPFKYLLGTGAAYKQVIMPDQSYSIVQNQNQFVHLTVDYGKLFAGIQFNNKTDLMITTPADNSNAVGIKLCNNISSMFSYEK